MKMSVTFFQGEYIDFFKELQENNNKEWFHANKETYKQFADIPFKHFIDVLLSVIKKLDQTITINAEDSIFRINRDLRFSKDKSPYKVFKSALISSKGRKSKSEPGFYLEIGAEYIKMACGCFKLSPSELKWIESNIDKVNAVSKQSHFVAYCGELIRTRNSLTFETLLGSELLNSEDLDILILTHWQIMQPVISVFKDILHNK